jgi:PTS system mannose-specific IID component
MFIQALLVAIIANLACGRVWSPITWPFCYPLINGTLVGFILGNPMLGLMAGATINLAYLGWISAGGAMPGNIGVAGVYGTAITILANTSPNLAITFAVPIGLLGILLWQLQMTLNIFWVHRCDINAEKGEIGKVWMNAALFPQLTAFLINGLPAFCLIMFGSDFIMRFVNSIPESFVNALGAAGGLIPALGVGMLLNYLSSNQMMVFFAIGFFINTYLGLGLMPIAIFGTCIAIFSYYNNRAGMEKTAEHLEIDDTNKANIHAVKLQKSDLIKHWLIGLGAEVGYNYERMQASGNVLAMIPIIKRLYKTKEDISAAMKRYLVFFNTEPSFVGTMIPGICASLEEERASGANISDETVHSLRTGLMGPMAGIGDTLAGGIIYPIMISISCSIALQGNMFAPFLFFAVFTGVMLILGYNLYMTGYKKGHSAILSIINNNSITVLTNSFAILGLMVVGAMGAERVIVNTPLQINIGQTVVVLQYVLDGLIKKLLPFAVVVGTWTLLKRKVSPVYILIVLMAIGIIGYYIGILG